MHTSGYVGRLAFAIIALAGTAAADQITLTPIADARVLSIFPTLNAATDFLSTYYDAAGNDQRTLIQFDLSLIPAGATIDSSALRLYGLSYDSSSAPSSISVYRVARPWVENQVTWVNAATGSPWTNAGGDIVGTTGGQLTQPYSVWTGNQTPAYAWYAIDVLSLTNDYFQGVHPNYGFALDAPFGNSLTFVSREGTAPSGATRTEYPELVVTYTPAPEPASACLLALGVLTLRTRRR